ncbi:MULTISPECIES: hypothetical protein [Halobacillus]|uniref:hypothetical protein n=1 Tax=Halobacillus TaxID=45667 RepID=UPI0013D7AEB7|nr:MULTISPECIES: hypothetical protein [Halobacillus]
MKYKTNKTVTINTYKGSFEVSENWLKQNTEGMNISEFLSSYTWDDGERLYNKLLEEIE